MKKTNLTRIAAAVIVVAAIAVFTSCDMGLPWDVDLWGEWSGDNSSLGADDTVFTITNETISIVNPESWSWNYSGEIIEFDNSSYYVADENPTSGDFGSLIFKITAHSSDYGQDQIGKYTVWRWKALTDTTVSYAESGTQFETLEEAEAADVDNFAEFSSITRIVE